MFLGRYMRHNGSVFGWSGLLDNRSEVDISEVLEAVSANWSRIIDKVQSSKVQVSGDQIRWSTPPQVMQCSYFDAQSLDDKDILNDLFFTLSQIQNVGVTIFVSDKLRKVSRTLKSNFETYNGPNIGIKNLVEPSLNKFYFTFEQKEYSSKVFILFAI